MAFSEMRTFQNRKATQNWTDNHMHRLQKDSEHEGPAPRILRSAEYMDEKSLGPRCWRMIRDNILNTPPFFKVNGEHLSYNLTTYIRNTSNSGRGKKTCKGELERRFKIMVPKEHCYSLTPSREMFGLNTTSDLIPHAKTGQGDLGYVLKAVGDMLGSSLNDLTPTARKGAISLVTRGIDVRHMALKAYLMLQQSILHTTMRDSDSHGINMDYIIRHANTSDMLERCTTHQLVVDCGGFSNEQAKLLYCLTQRWPLARSSIKGRVDIFSAVTLEEENAYLYTSNHADIHVIGAPDFQHPDYLLNIIVQVFSSLDAIDQLMMTFSECRGLAGMLAYIAEDTGEDELILALNYPISRGCNKFGGIRERVVDFNQVSHIQPSPCNLVLDLLSAEQGKNRLHCLGERLGLYNRNIFNNLDSERVSGVLRDHGYIGYGNNDAIMQDLVPWLKVLASGGGHLSAWLIAHATNVREYRYDETGQVPPPRLSLPLLWYDHETIGLSSHVEINSDKLVDGFDLLNPYQKYSKTTRIRKVINWLQAIGLGEDGFSINGLSWIGSEYTPAISDLIRDKCSDMEGNYKMFSVRITIVGAVVCQDPRGRRNHFFRNRELAGPEARTTPESGEYEESHRYYGCSSGWYERAVSPKTDGLRTKKYSTGRTSTTVRGARQAKQNEEVDVSTSSGEPVDPSDLGIASVTIPVLERGQALGDGNCALHALSGALEKEHVHVDIGKLKEMIDLSDLPDGFNWTDGMASTVAREMGYNLLVVNTNNNMVFKYDNLQPKDLYLYYTPADEHNQHGHYEPGFVKDRNKKIPVKQINNAAVSIDDELVRLVTIELHVEGPEKALDRLYKSAVPGSKLHNAIGAAKERIFHQDTLRALVRSKDKDREFSATFGQNEPVSE